MFYTTNGSHSHFYIILQALRLYRIWVIHQFVILALLFRYVVGTAIDLGCKWQKNPKITGFNGIGLFISCVKNVWIYVIQGPVCPCQMSATQVLSILCSVMYDLDSQSSHSPRWQPNSNNPSACRKEKLQNILQLVLLKSHFFKEAFLSKWRDWSIDFSSKFP